MYSYTPKSTPTVTGMAYGRIAPRSGGLVTYESLGTTYVATEDTTPETSLATPKDFSLGELLLSRHLTGEDLTIPTEAVDLDTLVRDATEAWRGLLSGVSVVWVRTEYSAITKEVENKTASGLFLPLDDERDSSKIAFSSTVFERHRATDREMDSIKRIEDNIIAMTTEKAPGIYL